MIDIIHAAYVQVAQVCWRALPLLCTVFLMLAFCIPVHLLQGTVPVTPRPPGSDQVPQNVW